MAHSQEQPRLADGDGGGTHGASYLPCWTRAARPCGAAAPETIAVAWKNEKLRALKERLGKYVCVADLPLPAGPGVYGIYTPP